MNSFTYAGKVEGNVESQKRRDGRMSKVFKGLVGQLPIWLFGRNAEAAEQYMGQHVVLNGVLESRVSDSGNVFPQFRIFQVHPTRAGVMPNTILLHGEVSMVKRIKDGLYNVGIDVRGNTWNSDTNSREETTYTIPVNVTAAADSDIGQDATVVARLIVRDGKFTDIVAESYVVAGSVQADVIPTNGADVSALDEMFT